MVDAIKVLMVDDEDQFRETTKKILGRRGFDTILAGSGEEAIDKLKENPDVVILDVKMPGMDGHQALRKIKKISPDLPVIMITGYGAVPSAREALVEGAFDYLAKPCDINILTARITDAYQHGKTDEPYEEKTVKDVMGSIEDYATISSENTVMDIIDKIRESFLPKMSTSRIIKTGQRSILVFNKRGKVQGIVAIADLLEAIKSAYVSGPKLSTADSMQFLPMFRKGMFTREVENLAKKKIKDIMSPVPLVIEADANLMEAAYMMTSNKAMRLVVVQGEKVVGIIREKNLFFEMEKILRR